MEIWKTHRTFWKKATFKMSTNVQSRRVGGKNLVKFGSRNCWMTPRAERRTTTTSILQWTTTIPFSKGQFFFSSLLLSLSFSYILPNIAKLVHQGFIKQTTTLCTVAGFNYTLDSSNSSSFTCGLVSLLLHSSICN